jgi:hypothetical protein
MSQAAKIGRSRRIHPHRPPRSRSARGPCAYIFARIGAVVNLKVEDYYPPENGSYVLTAL